jgi:hypothetical protein
MGLKRFTVNTFTKQRFTVPVATGGVAPTLVMNVLIIAGGGAGGPSIGAGGGAGGVLAGSLIVSLPYTSTVTIGAGAATGAEGTNGSNTVCFGVTAIGGGGAYSWTGTNGVNAGNAGGSGGGGAGNRGGTSAGGAATQTSQSGLIGYGNSGGIGKSSGDPIQPAGGGGAGGVGQDGINTGTTKAGNGGIGIYSEITGTNTGYAGGASGHSYNSAANPDDTRATWGGGVSLDNTKVNGVANKGGGGAGGGFIYGPAQGAGGSGVVIVRYLGAQKATGGTVSTYSAEGLTYTVHTFNSSSTFDAAAP